MQLKLSEIGLHWLLIIDWVVDECWMLPDMIFMSQIYYWHLPKQMCSIGSGRQRQSFHTPLQWKCKKSAGELWCHLVDVLQLILPYSYNGPQWLFQNAPNRFRIHERKKKNQYKLKKAMSITIGLIYLIWQRSTFYIIMHYKGFSMDNPRSSQDHPTIIGTIMQ